MNRTIKYNITLAKQIYHVNNFENTFKLPSTTNHFTEKKSNILNNVLIQTTPLTLILEVQIKATEK